MITWNTVLIVCCVCLILIVGPMLLIPKCASFLDGGFLSRFEESKDGIILSSFHSDGGWWIVWEDYCGIYRLTYIKGTDEVTFEADKWNLYGGEKIAKKNKT